MALTLINIGGTGTTAAYRGIPSDETGINCEKFTLKLTPEVNDKLVGITGEARARAISAIPMGALTISGEILNATGVMAATFGATAFVPTNATTFFGRSAGGFYLTDATVDYDRNDWKKVTLEFESVSGIA